MTTQRVYAERTRVPVEESRKEIERILARYGADRFAYFSETGRAIIVFEANNRRLRFNLPLPVGQGDREQQQRRQKWRALMLCIKAKLQSVESGIETFEDAFLAHVVLPDGSTVGDEIKQPLEQIYSGGKMLALLPPTREAAP